MDINRKSDIGEMISAFRQVQFVSYCRDVFGKDMTSVFSHARGNIYAILALHPSKHYPT